MNTSHDITIYLDHQPHAIKDRRYTGAEIRALTTPPATDLWLDVADAQDRNVPADATIVPVDGMRFYTSKRITVFINSKPYQIPAGTVSEEQLRALPDQPIGDDFVLFRDIPDALDRRLAPGEILEVNDGDRFFSVRGHHSHDVTIIVNATQHVVPAGNISFETLVSLAYPVPPGPDPEYTVSYRKGGPHHPGGTLLEGQSIEVREGMIFSVTGTDKS